ncbi:unnamed protein product [Schistosoma margrebowiei]|uniref:Uncharacterized protein n=1 Tax=Schistosoma margrebowiei TaxID=48269 RepID=A0A183MCI5_9TREM|nr:unnamed protein product [Schistosoma margrebowiei]
MKMIKGIQQLNIESSGENQMITESILETDNLEQNLHSLISTATSSENNYRLIAHNILVVPLYCLNLIWLFIEEKYTFVFVYFPVIGIIDEQINGPHSP